MKYRCTSVRRKNLNYLWSCHQEVIHRPRKREEKKKIFINNIQLMLRYLKCSVKCLYHAVVDSMWQHIDITNDAKIWQGFIAAWAKSMLPSCGDAKHKHWDGYPGKHRKQMTRCLNEQGIYTCRQLWVTGISNLWQFAVKRRRARHWNCFSKR